MHDVIEKADMVFTATGCNNIIFKEHVSKLKDGVILANLGHFDIEVVSKDLYAAAGDKVRTIRPNVEELIMPTGNKVYLLAQGRLANLAISEGHPSEVMDMSFGLQGLMSEYIVKNKDISSTLHAYVVMHPDKDQTIKEQLTKKLQSDFALQFFLN